MRRGCRPPVFPPLPPPHALSRPRLGGVHLPGALVAVVSQNELQNLVKDDIIGSGWLFVVHVPLPSGGGPTRSANPIFSETQAILWDACVFSLAWGRGVGQDGGHERSQKGKYQILGTSRNSLITRNTRENDCRNFRMKCD